jgi:hypothetical protein
VTSIHAGEVRSAKKTGPVGDPFLRN